MSLSQLGGTLKYYFEMTNILDLVDRELHRLIQYHRRQQSTTPWQTLSLHDGSDPPTVDDPDSWNLSEAPYKEWITNPDVDEEISLLLNRRHLEDGRD